MRDLVPGLLKDKEISSAPKETYAVCPADLNRLVDCSQMNSVMDTALCWCAWKATESGFPNKVQ